MKSLLIILFLSISIQLFAPSAVRTLPIFMPEEINVYLQTWKAVKFVEIGLLPDTTINDEEWAYGPGQIRQPKLDDFNLATGKNYTLRDCLKEPIAKEVFIWHCTQYNDIDLAIRRWNGSGPATYKYLEKVKNISR